MDKDANDLPKTKYNSDQLAELNQVPEAHISTQAPSAQLNTTTSQQNIPQYYTPGLNFHSHYHVNAQQGHQQPYPPQYYHAQQPFQPYLHFQPLQNPQMMSQSAPPNHLHYQQYQHFNNYGNNNLFQNPLHLHAAQQDSSTLTAEEIKLHQEMLLNSMTSLGHVKDPYHRDNLISISREDGTSSDRVYLPFVDPVLPSIDTKSKEIPDEQHVLNNTESSVDQFGSNDVPILYANTKEGQEFRERILQHNLLPPQPHEPLEVDIDHKDISGVLHSIEHERKTLKKLRAITSKELARVRQEQQILSEAYQAVILLDKYDKNELQETDQVQTTSEPVHDKNSTSIEQNTPAPDVSIQNGLQTGEVPNSLPNLQQPTQMSPTQPGSDPSQIEEDIMDDESILQLLEDY